METKITFILTFVSVLIVGIFSIIIFAYKFEGIPNINEYLALYVSVTTAIFTSIKLLIEPKVRTEPYLRLTPIFNEKPNELIAGLLSKKVSMNLLVENIGHSIAKNIEIKCWLANDTSTPPKMVEFHYSMLAPKENPLKFAVLKYVDLEPLRKTKLLVEYSFFNEENKKKKLVKEEIPFDKVDNELAVKLRDEGANIKIDDDGTLKL